MLPSRSPVWSRWSRRHLLAAAALAAAALAAAALALAAAALVAAAAAAPAYHPREGRLLDRRQPRGVEARRGRRVGSP